MVRMINAQLGTEMWVAEERVEEYKAAGHKLAASDTDNPADEPKKAEPRKSAGKVSKKAR